EAPVPLRVTVRGDDGAPVAGAKVTAVRPTPLETTTVVTDALGVARFDGLAGRGYVFVAEAEGLWPALVEPRSGAVDVSAVVERVRTIRGRVLAGGEPAEGATVEVAASSRPVARAVSGADGTFALRVGGPSHRVEAVRGGGRANALLPFEPQQTELDVTLELQEPSAPGARTQPGGGARRP
ncbi:MAG: carboxypeptidase regulatory-like domain-containing protein, partial [Myxococcales bacterium]